MSNHSHNSKNKSRLEHVAESQFGFFTSRQAIDSGFLLNNHTYHCQRKNWIRIDHGLYRLPGYPDTRESEFTRWCLWSRNQKDEIQAAVSHESALSYYGLIDEKPEQIHLAVPKGFRKKIPDEVAIHKTDMDAMDFEEQKGFRVVAAMQALREVHEDWSDARRLKEAAQKGISKGLLSEKDLLNDPLFEGAISLPARNGEPAPEKAPSTEQPNASADDEAFVGPSTRLSEKLEAQAMRLDEIESKMEQVFSRMEADFRSEIDSATANTADQNQNQETSNGKPETPRNQAGGIPYHNIIRRPYGIMQSAFHKGNKDTEPEIAYRGKIRMERQSWQQTAVPEFRMAPTQTNERQNAVMHRKRIAAFTLVELLVVVAILSVLAALLLPALSRARKAAESTVCVSNARQIGMGINSYLSENSFIFPPALWGSSTWADWKYSWMAIIAPHLGMDLGEGQTGWEIIPKDSIFWCPTTIKYNGSGVYTCCYGYNSQAFGEVGYGSAKYYGKDTSSPTRLSQITRAGQQLIAADSWHHFSTDSYRKQARYVLDDQMYLGFRHNRRANTLYADNHIKAEEQKWLWMGHPRAYPWNICKENKDWYLYHSSRVPWDENPDLGYAPYD